jgi:thymidylate synthase (FAD)
MTRIAGIYEDMIKDGIPKEDARMVLPNACFTSIVISMNARSFLEASTLRRCKRAQWEIREMFDKMRECIKTIYPTVYKLAVPNCEKNGCIEKKPCKKD